MRIYFYKMNINIFKILGFIFIISSVSFAQFGYYIEQHPLNLPDTTVTADPLSLYASPNREDTKAIGMGKTQIANGAAFNAMMYNPALLAKKKLTFDVVGIQASFPKKTFDAASYVLNNKSEFSIKGGESLKLIREGFDEYKNAGTFQERLNAIQKLKKGLEFPNTLMSKVVGSPQEPEVHGAKLMPDIQFQIGNFGFSLYGNLQTGFVVAPGDLFTELTNLELPDDPNLITPETLLTIEKIIQSVFDEYGNINSIDVFPKLYSLAYADIVGAAGYAYNIKENFSIGANLKVINRRFSAKILQLENLNTSTVLLGETIKDFKKSETSVSLDLGALYTFPKTKTQVGLSLLNVVPLKVITSDASVNFLISGLYYNLDNQGKYILNQQGDTSLVVVNRNINIDIPISLKTPFLINAGALQPIFDNWDVAFDWYDIAAQDDVFENYLERLRLGTEYRIGIAEDNVTFAFRMGMADLHFTGGLGINVYNIFQLDAAYAYDNFISDNSFFLQIKFGW